jgi:hypothetical protein
MGKRLGLSATEIWEKLSPKNVVLMLKFCVTIFLENVGDANANRFPLSFKEIGGLVYIFLGLLRQIKW